MRLAGPGRPFLASVLPVTAAGAIGLILGTALVAKPKVIVLLVLMVVAIGAVLVACRWPSIGYVGLIASVAFLPSYAGPTEGPLLVIPSAAASWLIFVAVGWRNLVERGRVFRPNTIDYLVWLFALLMAISIEFSLRTSRNEWLHFMFLWIGPYLGVRVLLAEIRDPFRLTAIALGGCTAILAPLAAAEYLGAGNIFHALNFNSGEYAVWARQAERFGSTRAAASFGHPIALSMFAATSALFSIAAALAAKHAKERWLWYASTALALSIEIFSVSRTGWLMLLIGMVGIVLVFASGDKRRRLLSLIGGLGLLVIVLSILLPSTLQSVPGFGKEEKQSTQSANYRSALIDRALEPGVLNVWGNPSNKITPFVNGSVSTDDAYIILADQWGLIPTFSLMLIGVALIVLVLRFYGREDSLVAFPVAAVASMVALFVVAFITQQQVLIWMLIGASGVAAERLATQRHQEMMRPWRRSAT